MYESSTVILATGISFGTPVKGEKEFLGKGVSYCATCDAMFYRNKTVAVAGFPRIANRKLGSFRKLLQGILCAIYGQRPL